MTSKTIYRKDYTPTVFTAQHVDLNFDLHEGKTIVTCKTNYIRNPESNQQSADLILNAEAMMVNHVRVNEQGAKFKHENDLLTIHGVPDAFTLETQVEIVPENNTKLEGLYVSGGIYVTQCEAEGFRRITPYLDRPDNLATFSVRIEADSGKYPVLLSNGNPTDHGKLEGGRHFACWKDPVAKPCYLFAMVAGDLGYLQDSFVTRSGNEVDLRIYCPHGKEPRVRFAMHCLKRSMAWDEEVFGNEYDLERFNVVAIDDFNAGAMENTSLNIFNAIMIYTDLETTPDYSFEHVDRTVAHEYFHHWSGNHVTCRDWFQLTLKEGLTVFRENTYAEDNDASAYARLEDTQDVMVRQFAEDAGPMAHPIRPDSYQAINNFYTATVYQKGGEVIRMLRTLLGHAAFYEGNRHYFKTFDGKAVTCDDYLAALEESSGESLQQFSRWYQQPGTPQVTAKRKFDNGTLTISLSQRNPRGGDRAGPLVIPVSICGFDDRGHKVIPDQVLILKEPAQDFVFDGLAAMPVVSYLRDFSAPVKLKSDLSDEERVAVLHYEDDLFAAYSAAKKVYTKELLRLYTGLKVGEAVSVSEHIKSVFGDLLEDATKPLRLKTNCLSLPGMDELMGEATDIDVESLWQARQVMRRELAECFFDKFEAFYHAHNAEMDNRDTPTANDIANREAKALALSYMCASGREYAVELAIKQFKAACAFSERSSALHLIVEHGSDAQRKEALGDQYKRYAHENLVLLRWFAVQAMSARADALESIKALTTHDAYDGKNPNFFRFVYGVFTRNYRHVHAKDGSGYAFVINGIRKMDKINSPTAAGVFRGMFQAYKSFSKAQQQVMRAALEPLTGQSGFSKELSEAIEKTWDYMHEK